jgi:capsular exopolysaccharide synthesis family protein
MPPTESQESPKLEHPAKVVPTDPEFQFSFHGLLGGLKRSRSLIRGCALAGLVTGLIIAFLPRHYTAISRIQVRPGSSSQYRFDQSDLLNLGDDSTKLETETMIIESDMLLLDVAHKLHLEMDPDFMGWEAAKNSDAGAPKATEKLLARLHSSIHATRIPRTEIIQVSCTSRSGILSARVVNMIVAEYIQRLFESRFSSAQRVTKWLSGQLDDLKQQVERDEDNLLKIQSRLGIVGIDQSHDILVTELEDLTKAADEARVERIIAEARYRILSTGDSDLLDTGQDNLGPNRPNSSQLSLLANLRIQKAQTEARLAGLSAQFGTAYPDVKQASAELSTLNREIEQEQTHVLNQAHQSFAAASDNEQNSFATLQTKKSQAFQMQNDMVQYQILLHDYESSRGLYEGLMQRLRQAGIVAGLESSEVDIVDMARVPGKPSDAGRAVTVALGSIFGLAAGLSGAFFIAQFDQRVQDVAAIETEMGIPLLSITPMFDRPLANLVETFLREPNSPFVESMWQLRTSLLLSNPGHAPRTVLFTSCNPEEGKTTCACAQACALALRDAKVLLIDADMRRPSVMRHFGLSNRLGLSSVLTGISGVEGAIQNVDAIPNLSVLTSGPIPPSPALLLGSDNLSSLFATLSKRFDFVIVDTPPLLGLVDSSSLAQCAEAIVLVLSYPQLKKAQIGRAVRTLNRVGRSITGIALNFADTDSLSNYGYGYTYSYPPSRPPKGDTSL